MFGFLKKDDSATVVATKDAAPSGWAERLKNGLSRTRGRLSGLFRGARIDDELLEELESTLLMPMSAAKRRISCSMN